VEVSKIGFHSDGMMSLYFDRQIILSPTSCWIFGPAVGYQHQ
jgi:hypothetical protein